MILSNGDEDITVHTDRKIKRKMKGAGMGTVSMIVSEPEDKWYRVSFHKCRRLDDNCESVPFGYIKDA